MSCLINLPLQLSCAAKSTFFCQVPSLLRPWKWRFRPCLILKSTLFWPFAFSLITGNRHCTSASVWHRPKWHTPCNVVKRCYQTEAWHGASSPSTQQGRSVVLHMQIGFKYCEETLHISFLHGSKEDCNRPTECTDVLCWYCGWTKPIVFSKSHKIPGIFVNEMLLLNWQIYIWSSEAKHYLLVKGELALGSDQFIIGGGGLEDFFLADYLFQLMFKLHFFFTHHFKPDFFFHKELKVNFCFQSCLVDSCFCPSVNPIDYFFCNISK